MSAKKAGTHWVGLDVGGTKMLACVLDGSFDVIGAGKKKSKGVAGNVNAGIDRMVETVDTALAESKLSRQALAGVGVGTAGFLDLDAGVIRHSPNLGWRNVKLRAELQKRLGVPVTIANDVDAGTYGEYRFGAGRGARCLVGVFPGTGLGGACVYEGRLLRGASASCMEIGHIPVQPGGRLCGCGRRGCLETVASRLAISTDALAAAYRGEAPALLKKAGTDLARIRSGVIRSAIEAGDAAVESIVRHAARQLGTALVGVIHLLAPDKVVLGGGLVEELPKLYLEEVRGEIAARAIPSFGAGVRVAAARLKGQATAMGAAALAADAAK